MLKPRSYCFLRHVARASVVVAMCITLAVAAAALLVDHGGRVLTTPTVSAIYLGDYWTTRQGADDQSHTDSFLQAWLSGPSVTGVLAQYRVSGASFTSSDRVAGAAPFEFTDDDAQALVRAEIAAARVVAGDQAVHVVFLPPGTVLSFQGNSSLRKLAGYHSSYRDSLTGKPVSYAVVVYNQGTNGLDFTGNPQDNITIIASRVLSGAFTNPDAGKGTAGWIDDTNGEVGDIAFALSTDAGLGDTFTRQNGFAVVLLWSNKDEKLEAEPATPASSTVLSVTPSAITIAQGASGTVTVTNAATATDTLTLDVSQLPANVTAAFTDTTLAPGASTTLTLTVDAAAQSAVSTFTVTGTSGTTTEASPVTITIGSGSSVAAADFSLTATPTSQETVRRGTVTFEITSAAVGTESVRIKLKALHVRSALRVTLSTNGIAAGETMTVTVRPTRDAARKTFEFILKGSSDQADVSIPLTVVVK